MDSNDEEKRQQSAGWRYSDRRNRGEGEKVMSGQMTLRPSKEEYDEKTHNRHRDKSSFSYGHTIGTQQHLHFQLLLPAKFLLRFPIHHLLQLLPLHLVVEVLRSSEQQDVRFRCYVRASQLLLSIVNQTCRTHRALHNAPIPDSV